MKRYCIIAIACALLLLAGCSRSGSADSDPETFLRELYGDRIVTQDGKFFYHWNAGERYLYLEHDTEYLQPLLASDYDRYDVLITDGSFTVTPLNLVRDNRPIDGEPVTVNAVHCMLEIQNAEQSVLPAYHDYSYVDINLSGEWYAIFMPPSTAQLTICIQDRTTLYSSFVRLDDPNAAIPDGSYRVTFVISHPDHGNTRYAASSEFTIRNGELAG